MYIYGRFVKDPTTHVPEVVICDKCGRHGYFLLPNGMRSPTFHSFEQASTILKGMVLFGLIIKGERLAVEQEVADMLNVTRPSTRDRRKFCDAVYPSMGPVDWSYIAGLFNPERSPA